MSESLVAAVREVERGWVWLYTAGMPAEDAERRLDEVAADSWDHTSWARERGQGELTTAIHSALQFVLGVHADVGWRLGLRRSGFSRASATELVIALLILAGLFVAVPVGVLLALHPHALEQADQSGPSSPLVALYLVAVLLGLGGTGAYIIDRRPIAGATLGVIGSLCFGLAFWWTGLLVPVAASGVVAALTSAWYLVRRSAG